MTRVFGQSKDERIWKVKSKVLPWCYKSCGNGIMQQ
jgi:hypothetical protein